MLVNYIQSIMLTVLEIICCKIFFESFAEKRSENNWRNCSIILGTVICGYIIALLFYDQFVLKQMLAIVVIALFMSFYFKIHLKKDNNLIIIISSITAFCRLFYTLDKCLSLS